MSVNFCTKRDVTVDTLKANVVRTDALIITGGGGGTSTFDDASFRIENIVDDTKQIAFDAASISAATTRTITMPDEDVTLIPDTRTITAGVSLSGGGDLSADRTIDLDIVGTPAETTPDNADEILIQDVSAVAVRKMTRANFLSGLGIFTPSYICLRRNVTLGTGNPFTGTVVTLANTAAGENGFVDVTSAVLDQTVVSSGLTFSTPDITVPVGGAGIYEYSVSGTIRPNANTRVMIIGLSVNGAAASPLISAASSGAAANNYADFAGACLLSLSDSDTVAVQIAQNNEAGAAVNDTEVAMFNVTMKRIA